MSVRTMAEIEFGSVEPGIMTRSFWDPPRGHRIHELNVLLRSLCVYDLKAYDGKRVGLNHIHSYSLICMDIDRDFFYDVVIPEVWKFTTTKYPGSRIIPRRDTRCDTHFSGIIIVTWQPSNINTPKEVAEYWEGYPKHYEGG